MTFSQNALATPAKRHKGACYLFVADSLRKAEACTLITVSGAGVYGVTLGWPDGSETKVIRIYTDGEKFRWLVDERTASEYKRDLSYLPLARTYQKPKQVNCYKINKTSSSFCFQFPS